MSKFIREIPISMVVNKDLELENMGFTLVWKEESIEVWYTEPVTEIAS